MKSIRKYTGPSPQAGGLVSPFISTAGVQDRLRMSAAAVPAKSGLVQELRANRMASAKSQALQYDFGVLWHEMTISNLLDTKNVLQGFRQALCLGQE